MAGHTQLSAILTTARSSPAVCVFCALLVEHFVGSEVQLQLHLRPLTLIELAVYRLLFLQNVVPLTQIAVTASQDVCWST